MQNLKILENPIKFSITAVGGTDPDRLHQKTWRGDATRIDVNALDGYSLSEMKFEGVIRTKEDALRLAEFFQVHAYCFLK